MKSLFEQMNGTYREENGYLIPNLEVLAEKEKPIGVWGQRHLRYIREYKKVFYTNLLTSGKLNAYLADIDEQAQDMFFRLVKQMAEKQGVTEELKASDQMAWVRAMNNIRACANEIVLSKLIYS